MIVETDNLKTVANYAIKKKVSNAWIYKLIADKKITFLKIDGVIFINEHAK